MTCIKVKCPFNDYTEVTHEGVCTCSCADVPAARLAALKEVREMVEKRMKRNVSRAKAMREQHPGSELYGETEQTYLSYVSEDSFLIGNIDAMIAKEKK